MKFGEGINKLQEKYRDYIIFAKNGIFYNAIGKDALFLEQEFKLKKTCFGKNTCKCGIPLNSIENFINKLEDEDIKYIVFDYIQGKNLKLEEQFIERYREDIGKNVNKEELKSKCKNCKDKKKINTQNLYIPNNEEVIKIATISKKEKEKAIFVKGYINEILDNYINGE